MVCFPFIKTLGRAQGHWSPVEIEDALELLSKDRVYQVDDCNVQRCGLTLTIFRSFQAIARACGNHAKDQVLAFAFRALAWAIPAQISSRACLEICASNHSSTAPRLTIVHLNRECLRSFTLLHKRTMLGLLSRRIYHTFECRPRPLMQHWSHPMPWWRRISDCDLTCIARGSLRVNSWMNEQLMGPRGGSISRHLGGVVVFVLLIWCVLVVLLFCQ